MPKAPAFQFYPGDWMQDTRPLSLEAKGAWIDILCAMWRSQERGKITLNMVEIARIIGATKDETERVLNELIELHICDTVTLGNGRVTLISRRMVREERERNLTRNRVREFRYRQCNADITPPSSSSSSSSLQKQKKIPKKSECVFSLPEWFPQEVWSEFLAHRKTIKASVAEASYPGFISRFDRLRSAGWPPDKVIDVMVEKGWRWFRKEWVKDDDRPDEDRFAFLKEEAT